MGLEEQRFLLPLSAQSKWNLFLSMTEKYNELDLRKIHIYPILLNKPLILIKDYMAYSVT